MKQILMLLFLFILWSPVETFAASETSSVLSIRLENPPNDSLLPGDTFTETFLIENLTSDPVKIRICEVTNEEHSKLFSALQGCWNISHETPSFMPLENLTTDWFSLAPKSSLHLPLTIQFPSNSGNEYQNAELKARFLFVYQCFPKDTTANPETKIPISISHPAKHSISMVPSTGDANTNHFFYLGLSISCTILPFLLHIKKKKPRSIFS